MLIHVTRLQYWKSEHTEQTCEDACGYRPEIGLFAIADGVGTALFSNIWARSLVNCFLDLPLLNNDPFEVEWWLREAQTRYQQQLPALEEMPWNVQQKAQMEGSYSTLAAVRFKTVTSDRALLKLHSFGDSCIFVQVAPTQTLATFPPVTDKDFDHPPICLPSRLSHFQRHFHRAFQQELTLSAGSVIVLATDAVARWLVKSAESGLEAQYQAWQSLIEQTPASWPPFIEELRNQQAIHDDDATALVLRLTGDDQIPAALQHELLIPLGTTIEHHRIIRQLRQQEFLLALEEHNSELAAILFGDGYDLRQQGLILSDEQQQHLRLVADAMQELLILVRREINQANRNNLLPQQFQPAGEQMVTLAQVWQRYAPVLKNEPCAQALRQTIERLGITDQPQPKNEILANSSKDEYLINATRPIKIIQEPPALLQPEKLLRDNTADTNKKDGAKQLARTTDADITSLLKQAAVNPRNVAEFQIICSLKKAYLFHMSATKLHQEELERSVLEDLVSDPLIQTGIEKANQQGAEPPIIPAILLPDLVQEMLRDRYISFSDFIEQNRLSEEDIKAMLAIILRRQLFEDYLYWEKASMELSDWLAAQRLDQAIRWLTIEKTWPWVVQLPWWPASSLK